MSASLVTTDELKSLKDIEKIIGCSLCGSRRQLPPGPEKLNRGPAPKRARFSTRWWPSSMSA